jgi:signal transduction histidine kinase
MKSIGELLRYDIQASMFQRVRISGQFVAERAGEYFLASGGNGARFVPKNPAEFHPGDLVEVAGIPELGGPSPVLREAAVRKTGVAPLPPPKKILANNLLLAENDATRVQLEAVLLNTRQVRDDQILDLQNGSQIFSARLRDRTRVLASIEPGTRVELTGIYAGQHGAQVVGKSVDSFELLLDSARDVRVLARPPWWTLKRLVLAMTMLAGGLGMAGVWIVLLRRQVERRTAQLERATRQREQAERARALDEERLRIARDLHDDLGSSLTEITMLGGMSLGETEKSRGDNISQIVKKARDSVNALDVIVWAVNPRENTLQSLADYLASYADEFLTASGITCRLNLPVSFPAVTLDGRTRHDLFLATKEALNNAVRHAGATEVELSLALESGHLLIAVKDNGKGFVPDTKDSAHGLGNMQGRLAKLGGKCHIDSTPGGGTNIALKLALPTMG